MNLTKSKYLFEQAQKSIPGGVNSPVRSFKNVGGTPIFIESANGAYLYDVDGNRYVDYIASWGPMILGHNHPIITKAIQEQASYSTSYGAPTELEIKMAELIKSMVPAVDMIRMVNSGTEACMSALRLARGYTNKNKFIKFEGCYHGHADPFLVKAGSGVATLNIQTIPGVTAGVSMDTLTCAYNDIEAVKKIIKENKNEIGAIIIEPVAGNMGCVLPQKGFLEDLRTICNEEKILLIFDEVMTGFRLAKGGAQELLKVQADIICFGKIIGGGLPVGAYSANYEIMNHIAPIGKIYQAGTLSGNPIAMRAGYTLLTLLNEGNHYNSLHEKTIYLKNGLLQIFSNSKFPIVINQIGSMISIHFADYPINNFDNVLAANNQRFNQFFHLMLERGIYLPPAAFESWFLNDALTYQDLDNTIQAAKDSLQYLD